MPPRMRTRATKVLKENINVKKSKVKNEGKTIKSSRKALADKTNSLSDDNASIDVPIKTSRKPLTNNNAETNRDDEVRSRRQRRLPPRYAENETLKNLSNSKVSLAKQNFVTSKTGSPTEKPLAQDFPTKLPQQKHGTNILESPTKPVSKDIKDTTSKKTSKNGVKQVPITKFLPKVDTRPKRKCHVGAVVENPKASLNVTPLYKTPSKDAENSLIASRPKRVCRLPFKFENHSISPNKFIPVLPCHSSTPIIDKKNKILAKTTTVEKKNDATKKDYTNILKASKSKLNNANNDTSNSSTDKSIPDTNNNGKNKVLRPKRTKVLTKLQNKKVSPDNKIKSFTKRLLDNSFSFRLLENKEINEKEDVYEFTFDPNEEPPPQKKKRKKQVKKRPPKPKIVILKSSYDVNVSEALANLKSKIKQSQTKTAQNHVKSKNNIEKATEVQDTVTDSHVSQVANEMKATGTYSATENTKTTVENVQNSLLIKPMCDNIPQNNYSTNITPAVPNELITSINPSNYASIRIEDIAADFEFSDHHNDINYSPVNSMHHPLNHGQNETNTQVPESNITVNPINKDPLNLQEDESFFEPPIASSSMNTSNHQPQASPWRVEFGALPLRWHNNTYVKPNMTPAVECSFINSEETSKKHVYTNLLSDQEKLPEIFDNPAPALKQTSIISFIKEVAERNANKKKRRQSQARDNFEGVNGSTNQNDGQKAPKKAKLSKESSNTSNNDTSADKENINTSNETLSSEKKKKDNNGTFFGFDESEDQENVSPPKINPNPKRVLRPRNVLQELTQPMPTRAVLPVDAKAKLASSEAVQLYEQLKTTEDTQFPVHGVHKPDSNATDADPSWHMDNEDSESVHLFEDIELVHHLKPHRKSYGKAKKVTFQQSTNSDSDSQPPARKEESSDDDDLADLSFHLPTVKETRNKRTKKKKPKKLLTKQEEKELEEWAKGFNSMCEDVDEFPLHVE